MTAGNTSIEFNTASPEETMLLGEALGKCLCPGLVLSLVGNLGAGKTHFVKGIARGNGLDDIRRVTSPTFSLVHEYPGRLKLHHVDVYRLSGLEDLESIGFDEFTMADGVTALEWADRVRELVPADSLWIEITIGEQTNRNWQIQATGTVAAQCLSQWQSEFAKAKA